VRHVMSAMTAGLLLAGCGSSGGTTAAPPPVATVTVTASPAAPLETPPPASTPAASTAASSPATSRTPSGPLALGEVNKVTEHHVQFHVAASAWEPMLASRSKPLDKRLHFAALLVKFCLDSGRNVTVSQDPWSLEYADGQVYEPSFDVDPADLPGAQYPFDRKVSPGRCVKGWVPFDIPPGPGPARAVYGGTNQPTEWALPH